MASNILGSEAASVQLIRDRVAQITLDELYGTLNKIKLGNTGKRSVREWAAGRGCGQEGAERRVTGMH